MQRVLQNECVRKFGIGSLFQVSCLAWLSCGPVFATQRDAAESSFEWKHDLAAALKDSALSGEPVLIKFEAVWCGPCHLLSQEFERPEFAEISAAAALVKVDVDRQPEVAREFDVASLPTVILVDATGQEMGRKEGMDDLKKFLDWFRQTVSAADLGLPDVLAATDAPTRTETSELIEHLQSRDPATRQLAMQRLAAFPTMTRSAIFDALADKGSLSLKLAVLEVLERWDAPIDGLDPWVDVSFTNEQLQPLQQWTSTPVEDLSLQLTELSQDDLKAADQEIDRLLKARNARASLSRLTQFGEALLPMVYQRLQAAESEDDKSRLTLLRYWLTASNELRLGWLGGLTELASTDANGRRTAAAALVDRVTSADQNLLLELFSDSDPLVRELSLKGLQEVGSRETDATLGRLLNDPDKNVRAAVLKQFATAEASHMAGRVVEYLQTETDAALIVQALRFMKTVGGDDAVTAVLKFTDHES